MQGSNKGTEESGTVYEGSRSCKISWDTKTQDECDYISDEVSVSSSTLYYFAVHAYDVDGRGAIRIYCMWFDASHAQIGGIHWSLYSNNNPGWETLEFSLTSEADAAYAVLGFRGYWGEGFVDYAEVFIDGAHIDTVSVSEFQDSTIFFFVFPFLAGTIFLLIKRRK